MKAICTRYICSIKMPQRSSREKWASVCHAVAERMTDICRLMTGWHFFDTCHCQSVIFPPFLLQKYSLEVNCTPQKNIYVHSILCPIYPSTFHWCSLILIFGENIILISFSTNPPITSGTQFHHPSIHPKMVCVWMWIRILFFLLHISISHSLSE